MSDASFMALALAEARKALGRTHPNPAVGAVLVKGGKVIATGFHARAGTAHAEVVALGHAKQKAKGATLYTTLEPCDHHGRTPPCTQAILDAGVKKVVFASPDPNPLVNGKGLRRLKAAGIEVVPNLLRAEADELNAPFFTFMRERRAFVSLKAAITLDGKIATSSGDSRWITGEEAREYGHQLRSEVDAIIVGVGTVLADDPQLTARIPGGRDPVRVVLDSALRTPPSARVIKADSNARTIVVTAASLKSAKAKRLASEQVELWNVPATEGRIDLAAVLNQLGEAGLLHALVEGGAQVHASMLNAGLADRLFLFLAPKLVGHDGLSWTGALGIKQMSRALTLELESVEKLGSDLLLRARINRR